MPTFGAINRRDLIYYLKQLGFEGPYSGKLPQFMIKDELRLLPFRHKITDLLLLFPLCPLCLCGSLNKVFF
jgi:hypothetical protein